MVGSTIKEIADYLGKSTLEVVRLMGEGKLEYVKNNGGITVKQEVLDCFKKGLESKLTEGEASQKAGRMVSDEKLGEMDIREDKKILMAMGFKSDEVQVLKNEGVTTLRDRTESISEVLYGNTPAAVAVAKRNLNNLAYGENERFEEYIGLLKYVIKRKNRAEYTLKEIKDQPLKFATRDNLRRVIREMDETISAAKAKKKEYVSEYVGRGLMKEIEGLEKFNFPFKDLEKVILKGFGKRGLKERQPAPYEQLNKHANSKYLDKVLKFLVHYGVIAKHRKSAFKLIHFGQIPESPVRRYMSKVMKNYVG